MKVYVVISVFDTRGGYEVFEAVFSTKEKAIEQYPEVLQPISLGGGFRLEEVEIDKIRVEL